MMFTNVFDTSHLPEVVLRTVVVYLGLLLAMRLAGKREVGQLKPFDLVTLLILSNAVQNAMVGSDNSLVGGLTAAAVILLLDFAVSALRQRYGLVKDVFEGTPTLLVHDGQCITPHLRAEGLSETDVLQGMREHGIDDVQQVKTAVSEVDGTISIIPKDQAVVKQPQRRFRRQQHA